MSIFDTDLGPVVAPRLIIDRAQVRRNLDELIAAAQGVPLRIASKSIRVRGIIEEALRHEGVAGVLAYSAAEALWLVENGARDVLVAYPSVDLATMRAVAADPLAARTITFMADLPGHIELVAHAAADAGGGPLRVAFDIDAGLRKGPLAIGAHRSSLRTPEDAAALGEVVARTPGVEVVGAMFYEAQVAGIPDATPIHRWIKKASMRELMERRGAVVDAIRRYGDVEFVNGGGTGSVHLTRQDPTITDIAVGSGLFTSVLFDGYRSLRTRPAAWFVSPVVRKPTPQMAVTFSGGYIASGPASRIRLPKPVHPQGLKYFGQEGPGEVQTPLRGPGAAALEVGDLVWFRHSKAGEVCERFDEVTLVENGQVVGAMPTYRGEGRNFG